MQSIRDTLATQGFVEVEGPTLHAIAGGAAARPFTHASQRARHALYLRIALELHLKRLLVGGIERVLRAGPRLSQRRDQPAAQSRVHDARGLPGLRRLRHDDGPDRGASSSTRSARRGQRAEASPGATARSTSRRRLPGRRTTSCSRSTPAESIRPTPRPSHGWPKQIGFDTAGKHPDVIKNEVFEEQVEDQLARPDLRARLSGQHLPADQAEARQSGRSPNGSSCSSRAWKSPTPTPS